MLILIASVRVIRVTEAGQSGSWDALQRCRWNTKHAATYVNINHIQIRHLKPILSNRFQDFTESTLITSKVY